MRRLMILISALILLAVPARAVEFEAPEVPESVEDIVPEKADSFGEGLWNVLKAASRELDPALTEGCGTCLKILTALLICGIVGEFAPSARFPLKIASCAATAAALLSSSASLLQLGEETVVSLSDYGKLLLPVMTGALAAQGGVSTSSALYMGTAFFDSLLSSFISGLLIPLIWLYLALAIANAAVGQEMLEKMKYFVKLPAEWGLKLVLYLFTGYMTVTGVVSGTADAAAVKAAKITISGSVPVVGGILSDASEAVLVSAGTIGSGLGVYGLITVMALFVAPFLKIGVQYLILKATAALSASFGSGSAAALVGDFATALGLMLAMVGTQTVLLLISTVCFMKGVG